MEYPNKIKQTAYLIIGFIIIAEVLDMASSFFLPYNEVTSYIFDISVLLTSIYIIVRMFRKTDKTSMELHSNRKRLKNIFDTLDVAIWSHDLKSNTLLITPGIQKLYGHASEEFYQDNSLWKKVIHPDDLHVLREREEQLLKGNTITSIYRIIRSDGEVRWIQDRGIPTIGENGELLDFNSVIFDITEKKESEDRYRSLVEMSPDIIAVYSRGKIDYINEAGCRLFRAKGSNELIGQPISTLIPQSLLTEIKIHDLTIDDDVQEKLSLEFTALRLDGTTFELELTMMPILYEGRMAKQIVGRDISQRKKNEETIKYMAYYDALTGLPNRNLFRKHLNEALNHMKDGMVGVMFLDLDRFKIINDTKGHSMGDQLLKVVAEKLQRAVHNGLVSRQGGDEFIILLKNIDKAGVVLVAERIIHELSKGVEIDYHEFFVTSSIGISLAPIDGTDEETLIKHADTAMYLAKERGKNNYQFYTTDLQGLSSRKMELENGLRKALEQDLLMVHYQPQVDLSTGEMVGMEALIRWEHPELGIISPSEFIPLAEETGLIVQVGKWILEKACQQNKLWQSHGYEPVPIGVNISVRQLQDDDIIQMVKKVLEDSGLNPKYLELEITESIMQNIEKTMVILNELKTIGVSLAIDDFGTGYSSLHYLHNLPIDRIKIDKSFVDNLDNPSNQEMVKTIIGMGNNLHFNVIAEGIENKEQVDFLSKNGCTIGQGYFFSGPLQTEQLEVFLKRGKQLA